MGTLPLLTQVFALTTIGALLWLTIRAFKTNTAWGFAVLLLSPFSATVFGVKHWYEQREPFLLYITTFTATLAMCIFLFTTTGSLEQLSLSATLRHGMPAQFLTGNNNANFMHASYSVGSSPGLDGRPAQEPQLTEERVSGEITAALDEQTEAEEAVENGTEPAREKEKPVRYRLTYIPIKINEARNYIGTTAKITRKNVPEKEYLITGASPRHIELAYRSNGGQFSFHFKNSDVENIRVLINEAY